MASTSVTDTVKSVSETVAVPSVTVFVTVESVTYFVSVLSMTEAVPAGAVTVTVRVVQFPLALFPTVTEGVGAVTVLGKTPRHAHALEYCCDLTQAAAYVGTLRAGDEVRPMLE